MLQQNHLEVWGLVESPADCARVDQLGLRKSLGISHSFGGLAVENLVQMSCIQKERVQFNLLKNCFSRFKYQCKVSVSFSPGVSYLELIATEFPIK